MEPDGTYEPGFVGIRFCQECNNMLYPKEDKENRILLYAVSARVFPVRSTQVAPPCPRPCDRTPCSPPAAPQVILTLLPITKDSPVVIPSGITLPSPPSLIWNPAMTPSPPHSPSGSAGTVITSRRPTTAASMSTRSRTKWTN
ncbi:PREDICTED: DNA-directed RNA polymerase II subunit RPB9 isoform X1 [Cercocebus atys]|uniref:DNA-directed RNA polymerase II subunit RPB9 isoform X1 n=1 Tax=Cercocebus atys TaxID=9531 RepID=UPI0005F3FBA2|nr:PREDICTED: DNA-directed RNA polymerase II subunit RPB9 isoform X1 [Cercocebus atys]